MREIWIVKNNGWLNVIEFSNGTREASTQEISFSNEYQLKQYYNSNEWKYRYI